MTEVGKVVLCALLSKKNGRRILIDTKHMSLAGKDWYYGCIEKLNQDLAGEEKIPIMSSHSAASGNKRMPRKAATTSPFEADRNYDASTGFNPWDINLSDAEIVRIHESNGLIGLNFDERILTGKAWNNKLHEGDPKDQDWRAKWTAPLAEHLYHFAQVIAAAEALKTETVLSLQASGWTWELQDQTRIWRRLAMGSDFDGAINPLDPYCWAIDYAELELQLNQRLLDMRDGKAVGDYCRGDYPLLKGLTNEQTGMIVDAFMRKNAMDFLSTYFTDAYRT